MMSFPIRLLLGLAGVLLFLKAPGLSAQEEAEPAAEETSFSIMLGGRDIRVEGSGEQPEETFHRATGRPMNIEPRPYLEPGQITPEVTRLAQQQEEGEPESPGQSAGEPAPEPGQALEGAELDPLDPGAVGLISGQQAGFSPSLWQGSEPDLLVELMAELPGGTQSPTANRLMARLLLSTAPLPSDSARETRSGDFLFARLNALYRAGDMNSLMEMFDQIGREERTPGLTRLMTETYLLDGDFQTACRLSNQGQRASGETYFLKINAICQALEGRETEARFTISLLEETSEADFVFVSLFEDLVQFLAQGEVPRPSPDNGPAGGFSSFFDREFFLLSDLTPLHIGLLKVLERDVELSLDTEDVPNLVLASLARWEGLALETKLEIADLALKRGILKQAFLKELVGAYRFSEAEKENAYLLDYESWGVKSDALFYALALEAYDYPEAIQNIQEGWQRARVGDRGAFMADLFFEAIANIPAEPGFVSFAPDAVRISLLSGHSEKAFEWYSMVRERAAGGAAEATRMLVEMWPMMITLDTAGEIPYSPQILTLWRRSLEVLPIEEQMARALLFYEILGILGHQVPENLKSESMLAISGEIGVGEDIGGASLGETLLRVLARLGENDTVNASPFVLGDALYTLDRAGLSDEGRHIVLEALLARGF